MDWTAFINDNSQALFALGGVFLGSALTLFGNFINNKFQAKENDKERLEKRKDAKFQLAVELMKNDIKRIEDVSSLMFEFINSVKVLNMKRETGEITQTEWLAQLKIMTTSEKSAFTKLGEIDTTTDLLVYISGDEIYSMYSNFKDLFDEYLKILGNPSTTEEDKENAYEKLVASGGKFQRMLREKLISSRDTEW